MGFKSKTFEAAVAIGLTTYFLPHAYEYARKIGAARVEQEGEAIFRALYEKQPPTAEELQQLIATMAAIPKRQELQGVKYPDAVPPEIQQIDAAVQQSGRAPQIYAGAQDYIYSTPFQEQGWVVLGTFGVVGLIAFLTLVRLVMGADRRDRE